jgi:hypothetical protein
MATTPNLQTTFERAMLKREMQRPSQDGCLRSRWSITPQMERPRPVWLESARDRTSATRRTILKVHSARFLHALCWFIFLL